MSGGGFSNYLVTKSGNLVRTYIQSPNFVAGVSGWAVYRNGSAEFNNVTIRGGEIIGGATLIYNGAPALGNLIFSESAAGGTDAYGNVYQAGTVSYDPVGGTYTQLFGGQIAVYNSTAAGKATLSVSDGGVLAVNGTAGAIAFAVGVPVALPLYASEPGAASYGTAETWHDLRPLANSFNGSVSGQYPPQYRANVLGRVEIFGAVGLPGSFNSVTWGTLAAGWRPGKTVDIPIAQTSNGGSAPGNSQGQYLSVDSSGSLQFHGLPAGSNPGPVFVDTSFPLDSTGLIQS